MRILLISTYELGRQPFGLASPAAWLRKAGHQVTCVDLAVSTLPSLEVREAEMVAFFLPMHTATRLAGEVIPRVRRLNPAARLWAYGLYAPLNEAYLRSLGVEAVLGGEFEAGLRDLAEGKPPGEAVSLARQRFLVPDRSGLEPLERYAHLHVNGERRVVGYTEASRGCKHLCRHCPVVPVYQGRFRIVPADVVLEDVRRQVAAGAGHITFGDPDFLNGPAHALRVAEGLHAEFPGLSFDITAKVEHLRAHAGLLPKLREAGCILITTAVESVEDQVLARLDKGHTQADFRAVVGGCRTAGIALNPTFVPFTPWTTWVGYRALLATLFELGLVDAVAPVQLGLRLLIPAGSRLLELPELQTGPFDEAALVYPWAHSDPTLDQLSNEVLALAGERRPRREVFQRIWELAGSGPLPEDFDLLSRCEIPYLNEPWYC